jgi:signal transduction histidine kinase
VHVIVAQTERPGEIIVELLPLEQQAKQDREERLIDQAQANKELIRNLAHEIKNPLGGIRGAAQLLQMEIDEPGLTEYTQVIIHEADRLQSLVDRLLAPHRRPHVVGDVNIHEVCERVRSLILAEFPRGLKVVRDYDTSIPEFRGDREQLIQAVLNIAHNACQALSERIAAGDAQLTFSHAGRATGDIWQAALPTGIGIACHRQRARVCRTRSRTASSIRWCRAGRRLRAGADIGANLCAAAPRPDRVRQRAGPDGFQDPDSVALTTCMT